MSGRGGRSSQHRRWRGLLRGALAGASAAAAADWPMLGFNAQRHGGTPHEVRPPFQRAWYRVFPDEGLQAGVQPVVAEGRLFIGTLRGVLYALESQTGRELWTFRAGGPILHAAAVAEGRVFFGGADGRLYAVAAADGRHLWSLATGAAIWNAPAVQGDVVIVGGRDGVLYAVDGASGRVRWRAPLGAPLLNSPAVDPARGRVYIGSEAMCVHALSLADGRQLWRSPKLPGASMRGYHPVIAPDGAVIVTTQPVISYDRMQELMLEMVREVFGDFASWRHPPEVNERLRAENFRQLARPDTYRRQLEYLRRRLTEEPAYQTVFVLDPADGRPRFVAPIVSSESMNGPAAPPLVMPDGRVIVKFQALLRSRYGHYSPFLNVGVLDTETGHITPLLDESRTYGWHDSLLLVHDEQCQLSYAGRLLINAHQSDVNALDLQTLQGYTEPLALNIHEPAPGEALALRLAAWRGEPLPAGSEWLSRGTAVYGGGSVLDVPVVVAGEGFYYLPSHELNSGCALIAYRAVPGAPPPARQPAPPAPLSEDEWQQVQRLPWDWDTLGTPRLKSLLDALPGPVPGTTRAPLAAEAARAVERIPDEALDPLIRRPLFDPARMLAVPAEIEPLRRQLNELVHELLERQWRPLVIPAGKHPDEAFRYFADPAGTLLTLMLARPFLDPPLRDRADARAAELVRDGLDRVTPDAGESRVAYDVPSRLVRIVDETPWDEVGRLYPLWLWSRTPGGAGWVASNWPALRERLRAASPAPEDDCGNGRLAGLMAYCRLAEAAGDAEAMSEGMSAARRAMRQRLVEALAHPRGGLFQVVPPGRSVVARWRRLTPEVGRLLADHAADVERRLMETMIDGLRPGWWLAWNVEQLWRNETPTQLPSTPLEIFAARALILREPPSRLVAVLDLPWCRADEFHIQKLCWVLVGAARPR
ncbi:MAG: PQQ-like beta-propeller repeat protein [Kiritimatiellae bacterium]|nr:PQQ-like beta-propeller repeat protein [Kiritimatiellia bacterium]